MKIKWKCKLCEDIIISDSEEHHKMDFCKCGECACDLEEHYCRWACKNIIHKLVDIEILEKVKI